MGYLERVRHWSRTHVSGTRQRFASSGESIISESEAIKTSMLARGASQHKKLSTTVSGCTVLCIDSGEWPPSGADCY